MKFQIVTNNSRVFSAYDGVHPVKFVEGTYRDVMTSICEMTREGYVLLSHPLSGSVKPNETPYKSVLLSKEPRSSADMESVDLAAKALATTDKFPDLHNRWNESVLADFQLIDHTLIASALESAVLDGTS